MGKERLFERYNLDSGTTHGEQEEEETPVRPDVAEGVPGDWEGEWDALLEQRGRGGGQPQDDDVAGEWDDLNTDESV